MPGPQLPGCSLPAKYAGLLLLVGMSFAVIYVVNDTQLGPGPPPNPLGQQGQNGAGAGAGQGAGSGAGAAGPTAPIQGRVPPVSDRHFGSGQAQGTSTGALTFNLQLPVDRDKAYAQDGLAWIAFDYPGTPSAILVSLDEPENSVAISRGGDTALGVDDQCSFDITVTATQVSGHISCAEADALRDGKRIGSVAIEVDFSAGS